MVRQKKVRRVEKIGKGERGGKITELTFSDFTQMMEEVGDFDTFVGGYFVGWIPIVGLLLGLFGSRKAFFKLGKYHFFQQAIKHNSHNNKSYKQND